MVYFPNDPQWRANPNHDAKGKFASGPVPAGSMWPEGAWDPSSPPLRQHMKELHPTLKLPRSADALAKLHADQHAHRVLSHHHGQPTGKHPPVGWKTGENVQGG